MTEVLLLWWHAFILRIHPEVRRNRKWSQLAHNRFWGTLEPESGYSSSQVSTGISHSHELISLVFASWLFQHYSYCICDWVFCSPLLHIYSFIASIFSCFVLNTFYLLPLFYATVYQSFLLCGSHSNISGEDQMWLFL